MTEKQERFIDEYIIDFNATRAAIAAGYSSKRANSQGVHLLSIPEIQAEVRRRKAEISAGLRISAERVLWEMAALGFSNIFDYVEVIDGELRLKELPPEKQGAVSSMNAPSGCTDSVRNTPRNELPSGLSKTVTTSTLCRSSRKPTDRSNTGSEHGATELEKSAVCMDCISTTATGSAICRSTSQDNKITHEFTTFSKRT